MDFQGIFNTLPMTHILKQGTPPAGGFDPSFLVLILGLFAIFYFFSIRPQQKERKERKKQVDAMKKGDKILTYSGIYGKVTKIKEEIVKVEIAENVEVEMLKNAIHQVMLKGESEDN